MRKNLTVLGLIVVILTTTNFQQAIAQTQQEQGTSVETAKPPQGIVLMEDTPVRLRLMQTLSSGTSKVNDKVDFEVIEAVKIGDVVVIPQGETAIATVTEARPKKSFGRAGKLNVNIDYVRLAGGDKAMLRATKGGSGGSHTAAMTGAVVATAIIFFPAAPLFFFIKGKNIIIPKGTEITAYVAANTPVTSASTLQSVAAAQPGTAATDITTIDVTSTPSGAEITVDGNFMGTTQSTLKLSAGEHTVKIEKSGYKAWSRTVTLNAGGDIKIDATLEKNP